MIPISNSTKWLYSNLKNFFFLGAHRNSFLKPWQKDGYYTVIYEYTDYRYCIKNKTAMRYYELIELLIFRQLINVLRTRVYEKLQYVVFYLELYSDDK